MAQRNPLFNKQHIREYLKWGAFAATCYIIFVLVFLNDNKYENFYFIYIGNFLFAAILGCYTFKLINREYEGKRSVSMLIAGHLALTCGIAFSVIMNILAVLAFHPAIFSQVPTSTLIENSPGSIHIQRATGLIFMLEANTFLVSGGAASFLNVILSYAAKRDQTRDKPTSLEKYVQYYKMKKNKKAL